MKIDATRFLLLTSVLTAAAGLSVMAGCSSKAEDPAPTHAQEANSTGTAAPTATTDGTPKTAPTTPPKTTTPPPSEKDAGAAGDSGGGGGGAACLDDKTPAVQPACPTEGAGDECTGACGDYETNFKKGVSADIRKCLTKAICQAGTTSSCTDKALAKVCADPTATTFCTPNVTGCKGANAADTITQASCETVAKGLTAAGRDLLQNCFETDAVCGDCFAKIK